MEKMIIIGGGGHCKVIIDAMLNSKKYKIAGIVDPKLESGSEVSGIKVLGSDDELLKIYKKTAKNAIIGVGSIGDCSARKLIYGKLKKIGFNMPAVIHPKAVVARDVEIGEGTFVAASATINTASRVGRNVIINTSSSIDHDCEIGDFVHIAPGVILSGGVKVGAETHIGVGAAVVQYLTIGRKCFIPAKSLVKSDMAHNSRHGEK